MRAHALDEIGQRRTFRRSGIEGVGREENFCGSAGGKAGKFEIDCRQIDHDTCERLRRARQQRGAQDFAAGIIARGLLLFGRGVPRVKRTLVYRGSCRGWHGRRCQGAVIEHGDPGAKSGQRDTPRQQTSASNHPLLFGSKRGARNYLFRWFTFSRRRPI